MQIRNAEQKDLEQIMEIINNSKKWLQIPGARGQSDYPSRQLIQEDIRRGHTFVGEIGGKIVATVAVVYGHNPDYDRLESGSWLTKGTNYSTNSRGAVDPSCQQLGIGIQFSKFIEDLCIKRGIHSIRGEVRSDNIPMQKYVMKNAAKKCGQIHYKQFQATYLAYEKILSLKPSL